MFRRNITLHLLSMKFLKISKYEMSELLSSTTLIFFLLGWWRWLSPAAISTSASICGDFWNNQSLFSRIIIKESPWELNMMSFRIRYLTFFFRILSVYSPFRKNWILNFLKFWKIMCQNYSPFQLFFSTFVGRKLTLLSKCYIICYDNYLRIYQS